MVSRSDETVCVWPSTSRGPTRRRISSNARGQSSSAPSSSPIRWSFAISVSCRVALGIHDLDADPLVVLALALCSHDTYAANLGGGEDVGAAVGLAVQADD